MPYIKKSDRITAIAMGPRTVGELNYIITRTCMRYITREKESYMASSLYAIYNEVIGALECAKLELYRSQIADYEELKKRDNGGIENE